MRFDVASIAGNTILSGAPSGRHLYAQLLAALPREAVVPTPVFLDFAGVEVATASYLRESVIEFRNFVRGRRSNFYPVIANARCDVVDEIFELVQSRGDVIMSCSIGDDGKVVRHQYIGALDPAQSQTFELVKAEGETTASKLVESQEGNIKATAWNNRLASLSRLGLIFEYSRGRAKSYAPLFGGSSDGS